MDPAPSSPALPPPLAALGDAGAYIFLMWNDHDRTIPVGALGELFFPRGIYAYAGSALRNLPHRLARHARRDKPLKWHVDHLSTRFAPLGAVAVETARRLECDLAAALGRAALRAFPGFGCSDCRCASHLFLLARGGKPSGCVSKRGVET